MGIPVPTPPPPRPPTPEPARPTTQAEAAIAVDLRADRFSWAVSTDTGITAAGLLDPGQTRADALTAAMATLLALPGLAGQRVDLLCTDQRLHQAVADLSGYFPTVDLVPCGPALSSRATARAARDAARAALPEPPTPPVLPVPTVTVATDGSYGRGRLAGWGWVSDDGRHGLGVVPALSPLAGELAAIARALSSLPAHVPLKVLSDSRDALAIVARAAAAPHGQLSKATGLRSIDRHALVIGQRLHRRTAPVEFAWVRAHVGHPLNEGADRLAVLARRTAEAGVRRPRPEVADAIVSDTAAALTAEPVPA